MIPCIDFAGWGDPEQRDGIAAQIRQTCLETGFFYVSGHQIEERLISRTFELSERFFALPEADKKALDIANSGLALRGYTALYGENNAPDAESDRKESFDVGPVSEEGGAEYPFQGDNQWPEDEAFRLGLLAYQDAMISLARKLVSAIALSLDLEDDVLAQDLGNPISILRLLHYPPLSPGERAVCGTGEHTDYGFITILAQDSVGGLQIKSQAGDWLDIPTKEGAFVVNIGDLVERLSNGEYKATLHRVISRSNRARYSIPFFFHADYDAVIAPLPAFVGPDRPARYAPITCGHNMFARYQPTYAHLKNYGDKGSIAAAG